MIILLLGISSSALTQTYQVSSFKIPLMVESKTSGRFIELIKKVESTQSIKFNIKIYPAKRTLQKFLNKEITCFFPLVGERVFPFPILKSKPFYLKKDFIFFRKGDKVPDRSDLFGATVGLTAGYPYPKELLENNQINFEYTESDESNMTKLALKRIDYFVVEKRSGQKAIKNIGLFESIDISRNSVGSQKVYFACHELPETKKLMKKIDNAFTIFKNNGYLNKLFPENY